MKGVFTAREGSGYDDRLENRYHFPNRYLSAVEKVVGDWIVYHEPRRGGGRMAYIAAARVAALVPDPERPGHSYALMQDFLPFDRITPIRHGSGFYEEGAGRTEFVGAYFQGRSIRTITDAEFAAIVRVGLDEVLDVRNRSLMDLDPEQLDEQARQLLDLPRGQQERRIDQILMNRPIRDAAFRSSVRRAYDYTCAITGISLRNGGGRPEVDGAHIWSVEDGGPDVVQNGIALSKTMHWMFDRGLLGIRDDYSLIVSHNKVPPEYRSLIGERERQIRLPEKEIHWPDRFYLAKHREKHGI